MTEAQMDMLDRCWQSGYQAYEAGIIKCVFAKGSAARKAWKQGWEKARHEYEDVPPDEAQ